MPERTIKRGYSVKDASVLRERKLLEGHPWETWKHALFNHLKNKGFGELNSNIEPLLHEWFVLRRRRKLRHEGAEEKIKEFKKQLKENYDHIFDNPAVREAFRFITERTALSSD
jgi:hypothetical protein